MDQPREFCFIGHVDYGKSTVCGHLYLKTGNLSDHEFDKLKHYCDENKCQNQLYSMILDIWEEERVKGKTHESTILPFTYNNRSYILRDNPGHKTFIRSMIEGITVDVNSNIIACLLISAVDDEFEAGWNKGQTKENIIIARSLGIENLVVLVNKMDMIDWNEEQYNTIVRRIQPFINSCKFKTVDYLPISGYKGVGLVDMKDMPEWYDGKCLMDVIDSVDIETPIMRAISLPLEWTEMIADVRVFWTPSIITKGFECTMHYGGKEYDVVIEDILVASKPYIRANEKAEIKLRSKSLVQNANNNRRFILRYTVNTVGYGIISDVIH